jgi:hypothetical protein
LSNLKKKKKINGYIDIFFTEPLKSLALYLKQREKAPFSIYILVCVFLNLGGNMELH